MRASRRAVLGSRWAQDRSAAAAQQVRVSRDPAPGLEPGWRSPFANLPFPNKPWPAF